MRLVKTFGDLFKQRGGAILHKEVLLAPPLRGFSGNPQDVGTLLGNGAQA